VGVVGRELAGEVRLEPGAASLLLAGPVCDPLVPGRLSLSLSLSPAFERADTGGLLPVLEGLPAFELTPFLRLRFFFLLAQSASSEACCSDCLRRYSATNVCAR